MAKLRIVIAFAGAMALSAVPLLAQVEATYLYTLSSFSGPIRYDFARIHADEATNETYVLYQNLVRIFSPSGMEVYSFGDDLDLGQLLDAVVDTNGDIILLSYKDGRSNVTRCNFRGVPQGPIEIRNLPAGLEFSANRMVLRNGLFYFATLSKSTVIVTHSSGEFLRYIDFLPLIESNERPGGGAEMNGFAVDNEGNMLFSVATQFKVFKFSPDGKLAAFGRSGSAPGRFGVVAGVASDSRGNVVVTDKLKCVVMVFDGDFNFVTEFGYRGSRPENLILPDDVAIDGKDRVYVSQGRRRGISVFAVTHR